MSDSPEDTRAKIAAFLTDALASRGEFTVDRISLVYTPRGSNRRENLRVWKRSNEIDRPMFDAGKIALDKLTRAIVDLADHQLDTLGGKRIERFKIVIEQVDGTPTTYAFALSPLPLEDDDSDGDDGDDAIVDRADVNPSRDALIKDTMTMNRELHIRLGDMMDKAIHGMTKSVAVLASQNDGLRDSLAKRDLEREQWQAKVEEAAGKKHEREMESAMIASKIERDELALKEAIGFLPVLKSRLLEGGKSDSNGHSNGNGNGHKPHAELARLFAEIGASLSEEQKGVFLTTFSLPQQAMLNEITLLAPRGGGVMLAEIAHKLFQSMSEKVLRTVIGALTEAQGERFARAMKLAEAAAGGGDNPSDASPAKPDAPQPDMPPQ